MLLGVLVFGTALNVSSGSVAFPLEWDPSYRTDVPYEVDLSPAKLQAKSFSVFADGKPLAVSTFPGKLPGNVTLRFNVPEGTKALTCEGKEEAVSGGGSYSADDNPFKDALSAANVGRWKMGKGISAKPVSDGLEFTSPDKNADGIGVERVGNTVSYTVDIPVAWAGMPVVQEIELENRCRLVVSGKSYIEQLDDKGNVLPETVADIRWTSHMRPYGKTLAYRDEGHIHLKARQLRFVATVSGASAEYDAYGYPIKDPQMTRGSLAVKRIAVRPAAILPFPKWNDRCFGAGVSGTSLQLGGDRHQALFYQATSRAGWSQKHQFRNDAWRTFPAQRGTVEAWFRRRACDGWRDKALPLFEANQSYSAATHFRGNGSVLRVDYRAADRTFLVHLTDVNGKTFDGAAKDVELPADVWTHVALQWNPGGKAELFVGGKLRLSLPLAGFVAPDYNDRKIKDVNDAWAMEFFFGSDYKSARLSDDGRGLYFEGEGDELRVSSVCRYTGDFTPTRKPSVDGSTSAYFSFDRTFDGVMGTGFGFIPASIRADDDRVDHQLTVKVGRETKTLQYYPKDILPENDPEVVFNTLNYPVLPSDEDFRAAKARKTKTVRVSAGDRVTVEAGPKAFPAYTEFRNLSETAPLRYPILVEDGRLDPRSFGDLSDSLGIGGLSDREKANRVFQYMLSASDYFANHQVHYREDSEKPVQATMQAMVVLNSYCGFECGPLNNMTANMMAAVAGCAAGVTGGYGHEFEQVFFDGKNHIYDLSAQKFFPAFDNETSAYLKEMGDQPGLKQRRFKYPDHFIRKGSRGCWVNSVGYCEKFGMILNPGERLRLYYSNRGRANNLQTQRKTGLYGGPLSKWAWDYASAAGGDASEKWVCRKDRIFNHRSAAVVDFDGKPSERNPAFAPDGDTFTYRVKSCYPVTFGAYGAYRRDGSAAAIEISTDGGKTFTPIASDPDGVARSEYRVKGRTAYLVRVKAPMGEISRFTACTEAEVNPRTYPGWVMKGGPSSFQFKAEPGEKAEVTLAWNEPAKEIIVEGTAKWGTIPGCERELVLLDPSKPLALKVAGLSSAAKVRTHGSLSAALRDGTLTLRHDDTKPRMLPCGADNPEPRHEFPQFAAVDIVDGEAVKTVAVLISPRVRLALVEDTEVTADKKSVKIGPLPAGKYALFALGRFNINPKGAAGIAFAGPFAGPKPKKSQYVCRARNSFEEYLKAKFGKGEGRARWKWDLMNTQYGKNSNANGGADYAVVDLPATDHLDFRLPWKNKEGEKVELGAVMVVPDPDRDFILAARVFLFGYNCDPFQE